jgi:hypothetical protein
MPAREIAVAAHCAAAEHTIPSTFIFHLCQVAMICAAKWERFVPDAVDWFCL